MNELKEVSFFYSTGADIATRPLCQRDGTRGEGQGVCRAELTDRITSAAKSRTQLHETGEGEGVQRIPHSKSLSRPRRHPLCPQYIKSRHNGKNTSVCVSTLHHRNTIHFESTFSVQDPL
jgi:hypothetical protein